MAVRETNNGDYYLINLVTGKRITEDMNYEEMDRTVDALRNGNTDSGTMSVVFDW